VKKGGGVSSVSGGWMQSGLRELESIFLFHNGSGGIGADTTGWENSLLSLGYAVSPLAQ